MAYSFDGINKRITLSAGTVSFSLVDLHSRWKEWVATGNAQFAVAFKTVGGDIPAIPLYLFLLNGWRIVPQQADHTLTVADGILEVDGGGDPFVDPAGSYKIRINRQTPGIAIGYSTTGVSGPSAADIAAAILATTVGNRPLADHIKAQSAVLLGDETGAGTTHITFTDGSAVVEADVPLPGQTGNRTNVTISV